LSGPVFLNSPPFLPASVGANPGITLTISGVIADADPFSPSDLVKVGTSGVLALTNANTYSGATVIHTGTLILQNAGTILNTTSISTTTAGSGITFDDSAGNFNMPSRVSGTVPLFLNGTLLSFL